MEVMPRPIPARMKPGSSTSQLDVAVRWAIEASPAAAAAMATPSSTRIAHFADQPAGQQGDREGGQGQRQEPQPGLDRE